MKILLIIVSVFFASLTLVFLLLIRKLRKKISKQKNTIAKLRIKIGNLIQKQFDDTSKLYPYIPDEWKGSFFQTRRDWIINNKDVEITSTIDRINIAAYLLGDADASVNHTIVAFCNMIIPTRNGNKFMLSDPYDSITTEPLTSNNDKDILSLAGRIVIVKLNINNNKFYVKEIKRTIYTQFGIAE
ncbi:hypothetical protein [Vallitalea guaymasensis]|uniref:hypothetical protein n=1 Tax=Vallitalea guaymasensis TaxID=1185412 RepID=UPI000DE2AA05|nr:hypothetical protein [Vallitalea guaymasensis]